MVQLSELIRLTERVTPDARGMLSASERAKVKTIEFQRPKGYRLLSVKITKFHTGRAGVFNLGLTERSHLQVDDDGNPVIGDDGLQVKVVDSPEEIVLSYGLVGIRDYRYSGVPFQSRDLEAWITGADGCEVHVEVG